MTADALFRLSLLYLLLAGLISRGKAWPGHPAIVT